MAKVKTTKADFELFKKEVRKWVEKYGLNDNEIILDHRKMESLGYVSYNYIARLAHISLSKELINIEEGFNKTKRIKEVAFHEATELLLIRMHHLASSRYIDADELDAETHAVIHRLQRLLL